MEDQEDREIRWLKIGGGTHRMKRNGRLKIVKPNERFKARPSEISESFRDIIKPLDKLPEEAPIEVIPPGYSLKHKGGGWYDIIDGAGKTITEKAVKAPEAQAMMESLIK